MHPHTVNRVCVHLRRKNITKTINFDHYTKNTTKNTVKLFTMEKTLQKLHHYTKKTIKMNDYTKMYGKFS